MERLPLTPHEWHGTWNYTLRPEPLAPPVPPLPRDTSFGRFPPGDKTPAWLRHPSLTGLEPAAFDDLVIRYRAYLAEHPRSCFPANAPTAVPAQAAGACPPPTNLLSTS